MCGHEPIENYLQRAQSFADKKDYQAALEEYARVRNLFPLRHEGYSRAVFVCMLMRDFAQADQLAGEGIKRLPDEIASYVVYADSAAWNQKFEIMLERSRSMRQKFPDREQGYGRETYALMCLNQFDQADEICLAGLTIIPTSLDLHCKYAETAMRKRDFREAVKRWQKTLEKFPACGVAYARAAEAYMELGDYGNAERVALEGQKMAAQNADIWIAHAETAMRRNDYQIALRRWEEVIIRFPHSALAYCRAAYLYDVFLKDREKAESFCKDGMKKNGDALILMREYAEIAFRNHDYGEAFERWEKVRNNSGFSNIDARMVGFLRQVKLKFTAPGIPARYAAHYTQIIDDLYVSLCDDLVQKHNLGTDGNLGLVIMENFGDSFFALSAMPYVEKKYNKNIYLITNKGSISHKFLKMHNDNGANLKFILIDDDISGLYFITSHKTLRKFDNIIEDSFRILDNSLFNFKAPRDVCENLRQVSFQLKNEEYIKAKYNLIPERTVVIIPMARFHSPLPDYFWKMAAKFYSFLGYRILINSSDNKRYGDIGVCIYPPFEELASIVKIAGNLLSIRTGIAEVLAVMTKARTTIVGSRIRPLKEIYPYLNDPQVYFFEHFIERGGSSGFDFLDRHIKKITDSYNVNKTANPLDDKKYIPAKIQTYIYHIASGIFDEATNKPLANDFFTAKYSCEYRDGFIDFSLIIDPPLDYEMHVGLFNVALNKIEQTLVNFRGSAGSFTIVNEGVYSLIFKFFHPIKRVAAIFRTEPISVKFNFSDNLVNCRNFLDYLKLLSQHKSDLILFIVVKDAIMDPQRNEKLNLKLIGIDSCPEKVFRASYVAIVNEGKLVYEELSNNQRIKYNCIWDDNLAVLVSNGYNVSNSDESPASIKINGREYAINLRGLNIVVWDKKSQQVIDSVAFDTFHPAKHCYRMNSNFRFQPQLSIRE